MKRIRLLFFIFFTALVSYVHSQTTNNNCANATPFCTGQTVNFPATTGVPNSQGGPNYGCLGSQPNPAWFFLQISQSGSLSISIAGTWDVDFICWGPFNSLNGACSNLTSTNTIDCSYSASPTETCDIANAIPGQFYLLLITNFSNQVQNITFNQSNFSTPGAGATNCGFVCVVTPSNSGIICSGQSATISVNTSSSVSSFTWTGPGGFSSTFTNNVISNILSTSVYTVRGIANSTINNVPSTGTCQATTTVSVMQYPNFTVTPSNASICQGGSFNATATFSPGTNPNLFSYSWDPHPGAGIWSPFFQSTPIAPLLLPTTVTLGTVIYSVTVWPTSTLITCPITKTLQVTINNPLTPSLTMPPPLCDTYSPVFLMGSPGSGTWTTNSAVSPTGLLAPALVNNFGKDSVLYSVNIGTCVVTNKGYFYVSKFYSPALTSSIVPMCVQDSPINLMGIVQTTVTGSWTGPNVSSNFFGPAGLATGNYSLTHLTWSKPDPLVCPASTVLVVSVFNPPIPNIVPIKPKCNNEATAFLVASPAGGLWSGSSGVSFGGLQTPSLCLIGTNTVTYTAGQGTCVASSSRTFHVSQFNTAALSGTVAHLCVTSSPVNLMGIVQNTNGAWGGINVNANNYFNPAGLPTHTYSLVYNTVSTPTTGPYAGLCPDTQTIAVSVLNPAAPSITQVGPFCTKGTPIQLMVSPATGSWIPSPYLTSGGIFTPSLSPVGSNMVQYIIGTHTCNTQQTKYISTEAFVTAAIPGTIPDQCNTSPAVNLSPLTLSNLGLWSGPGVSGTLYHPSVSGAGKYVLYYKTSSVPSGLCPDQATVAVQVYSLALPAITKVGPLCNNTAAMQLQVSPVGGLFGSGITGAVTPAGLFNPALGVIGTNIISYSISVGPCLAYAQTSVSIERFVSADFEKIAEAAYCKNAQPFDLNSLVQNPGGLWSGPAVSGSMFNPAGANIGDNNIIVYQTHSSPSALLCPDTSSIRIRVKDVPSLTVFSDIDKGCVPVQVTLNSPNINSGKGSWNMGDGSEPEEGLIVSHIFNTPGSYTVVFNYSDEQAQGCSTQVMLQRPIVVFPSPKADFSYYPEEVSVSNPEVSITNRSTVLYNNKYQWTIQGMNQVYELNPQVTFPQVGTYKVSLTATTIDGCKSEISKIIEVKNDFNVFIPNSFSPNEDGLNDRFMPVFSPYGLDTKTFQMEIFDRWGHILFTTKDYTKGWDGTVGNRGEVPLKQDSYIYKIRYKDLEGRIYDKIGDFSLLPN